MTVTTKIAKNGAKLWYVDGKRTSRDKAIAVSFDNGRENLSNLLAGSIVDYEIADASICIEMNGEFGGRYDARFCFKTVDDAVKAGNLLNETLGGQIHGLKIDNNKSFPNNIVYARNARNGLFFTSAYPAAETENADVDEDAIEDYYVSQEAFDLAVEYEIEQAADAVADTVAETPEFDAGKNYTLTVHATEDFKELYGDTLVKNYATCQHLYNGGKHVIFTNSWEIVRGGKTIATGDGINAFCRFITCEYDVRERLAEIADNNC